MAEYHYAECRYDDCRYAECRDAIKEQFRTLKNKIMLFERLALFEPFFNNTFSFKKSFLMKMTSVAF